MSSSATFNENFYLTNNADVVVAISQGFFSSALQHYNLFGGKELRAPNATFDPNYYAVNNPDVLNAVASGVFANVFEHYKASGRRRTGLQQRHMLPSMQKDISQLTLTLPPPSRPGLFLPR